MQRRAARAPVGCDLLTSLRAPVRDHGAVCGAPKARPSHYDARMVRALWLIVIALAACKGDPPRQAAPPAVTKASLVIRDVRVFDGVQAIASTDVAIDGDTIVAVGPGLVVSPGAVVVAGAGKTLLPGLIDAHAHVHDGSALEQALAFGVTTELDMFAVPADAAKLKAENLPNRADLRSAGTLATAPGGHGTQYGLGIPTVTRPDEAQAFADARFAEGSDYLKIVYEDGSSFGMTLPTVDAPTLVALIDAAHARHKMAVVHISEYDKARTAIDSGADGLVHSFKDVAPPADFGAVVAKAGAFVVPTLAVLRKAHGEPTTIGDDPAIAPYLGPAAKQILAAAFSKAGKGEPGVTEALIAQLVAAPVPILVGTDAPNAGTAHGASVHDELALLVAAGVPTTTALAGATSVAARAFGLADRGRIASGMRADLVLVEGDPTVTITDTRRIVAIWRAGAKLDRDAYRAKIDRETKEAATPVEPGPLSAFDDGTLAVRFGQVWEPSTDAMIGGASTVTLTVVDRALRLAGEVKPGDKPEAWAGAMFMPGPSSFAPVALSRTKGLAFSATRVTGTGGVAVMVFTQAGGYTPGHRVVPLAAAPTRVQVSWQDLGIDPKDVTGIFLGRDTPGAFELVIDDVALE